MKIKLALLSFLILLAACNNDNQEMINREIVKIDLEEKKIYTIDIYLKVDDINNYKVGDYLNIWIVRNMEADVMPENPKIIKVEKVDKNE